MAVEDLFERRQFTEFGQIEIRFGQNPEQTIIAFDALESEVSGCISVDVGDISLADTTALAPASTSPTRTRGGSRS